MVKLAFGSLGDSFSATSVKAYVAEFIATLLFVFAGVGSAIAYGELNAFSGLICTVVCFISDLPTAWFV